MSARGKRWWKGLEVGEVTGPRAVVDGHEERDADLRCAAGAPGPLTWPCSTAASASGLNDGTGR